jgi:Nucleotidyl transferase AbiEii toxin, Type IV TA system
LPITSVRVSDSGEEILVDFESIFGEVYVLPRIKLEFGSRNATLPSETVRIEPDVLAWEPAQVVTFSNALVPVLLAERTYWEKVTLIHAENTRRNAKANTERYSRHWYDLAMLSFSPIGARALARTDLRDHVIATKTALFGVAGVNYAEVAAGACRLVPSGALNDGLERDYASMLEAGMFDSTPPAWAKLMGTLADLEIQINSLQNPA